MRKDRGNIILTALFISIFLFFLSVALIWTNRQDIALSLSMEHKLKAQSAARSGAYEALARLKQLGSLEGFRRKTLANGAVAEVELVSSQALGRRGEVLQLRARGTSGPLSSYLTLHLLDVRIAGENNSKDGRVLFFPASSPSEDDRGNAVGSGGSSASKALFGDFILAEGGDVVPDMVASEGPVFVSRSLASAEASESSEAAAPSPPYFVDYVPVFSEDGERLSAWGPTYVVAPPFPKRAKSVTSLQVLEYKNDEFEWVDIEPPVDLGDGDAHVEGEPSVFEMWGPDNSLWTTSTLRGIGERAQNLVWTAEKPPTLTDGDIEGPVASGEPSSVGALMDWSLAGRVETQEKFVTRGAIAADGSTVFSHGWHYVYKPFRGSPPGRIESVHGSTLVRWPCLLKYELEGRWSKVWTPLDAEQAVQTEVRPDPDVLLVGSGGQLFSVTEPEEGETRKLISFSGSNSAKVGDAVPSGQLFVYKGEPYLIPTNPVKPGALNLLTGGRIGFETLPAYLPELYGEVVDTAATEDLILEAEGTEQGEALDSSKRRTVTARPRYDFSYRLLPIGAVATDGNDLWAIMEVAFSMLDPAYPKAYKEPPIPPAMSPLRVLARYDGTRWHILPNGLRAALLNGAPGAPGQGVVAALYPNLPEQVSRYTVISIDTDYFRMGEYGN